MKSVQSLTFVKASCHPAYWTASEAFGYGSTFGGAKPKVERTCRADSGLLLTASLQRQLTTSNAVKHRVSKRILNDKGTMNFPNLASQIALDGANINQGVHKVLNTFKIFISQKPYKVETLNFRRCIISP